jgi:YD repeat-containing protein
MAAVVKLVEDLFLDPQDRLSYRDVLSLMEYPFFSISKKPAFEARIYDDGTTRIEVQPGHRGLATIWDKDLLIYIFSQITRLQNEGQEVSPKVRFHAHDFFVACGRSSGGRAYEDLALTLDRLQSTSIRTNITTKNGQTERTFFSWIKSGRMSERTLPNGKRVLGMVEVELEDWVYRQVADDRTILMIDQDYFQLTSGVLRRIYELARKHCGNKTSFAINLSRLAEKIGYELDDMRNFKRIVTQAVADDELPEYHFHVALIGDPTNEPVQNISKVRGIGSLKAVFTRRLNVSDRRPAPLRSPGRRIESVLVSDRRPVAPALVSDRRVEEPPAAEEQSPEERAALSQQLGQLMDRLAGNMKLDPDA